MWQKTFTLRLAEWNQLRAECTTLEVDLALERINSWWHQTPWCPYHLHWDYQDTWPTPWEILDDNVYCPLTRALGMIYTIVILELPVKAELVETASGDHLVIVNHGEHILNWDATTTLNNEQLENITHRLPAEYFAEKF